ncbi:group II intron reverse transcriptase/maturase, partial [Salmonella enterica subsp. enterica serovar Paratyphi A]
MELLEKVLSRENLLVALERVERNKGSAGIDGVSTEQLRDYIREHWLTIKKQIMKGTYKPSPVRRVEIPKSDGGVRLLGIPTVIDRFIKQDILQVLTP